MSINGYGRGVNRNGKTPKVSSGNKTRRLPKLLVPIMLAGVLILATLLLLHTTHSRGNNDVPRQKKSHAVKKATKKATAKSEPFNTRMTENLQSEQQKQRVIGKTPTGLSYVAEVAQTNNDGVVVSRYQLEDGSWVRAVTLQSKDTLIFDSALDNQFALIAMTPLNQMLPPMPPIGDVEAAFAEAVKTPIVIHDSDPDKIKELKFAVRNIRLQVSDLLREGYTVGQILSEDTSLRSRNITFRRELQKELNDIYRSEGREAAEEYMNLANEKLDEQGVIPLSMPESGNSKKRER